ncbi:hypothetical protein [Lentzea sp. CC55]|uniref:DUF7574 domain-containing protein n=1 Tax=Lentzea sp. CC55 TaxID=2884909 RepID=UPI001F1BAD6C|nr:hypothetical protein [Lentzea sp. CC55]MCG8926672.1 hypothetical protein [Lentzea sp. CC55]
MTYDRSLRIDGEDFEIVAAAGEYDWSWREAALLRSASGELFYLFESGCSCESLGSYTRREDLTPVQTWQQAVELAKQDLNESHVAEFATQLNELRPARSTAGSVTA